MIDREHAAFTQTNNVIGTLNVFVVSPGPKVSFPLVDV